MFDRWSQVWWLLVVPLLVSCARSHTGPDAAPDADAERDAGPAEIGDAGLPSRDAFRPRDASRPLDGGALGEDAAVPRGPWADVDCDYEAPPPFPPPDGPARLEGWWRWGGPAFGWLVQETKIAVDPHGRLHLAFVDGFDVIHATGVPGAWERSEVYTAPGFEDGGIRELSLVLTGEVPHLGYSPWSLTEAAWAHRPCAGDGWEVAATPFARTTGSVNQPGLAFDRATGVLHAAGAVEAEASDSRRAIRVGVVELPGDTVADSPVRVANWLSAAVAAVAHDGYLHVYGPFGFAPKLHSRSPGGRWRSLEMPRRISALRMVADDDSLHVFVAVQIEPGGESIRELLYYRVDVAEWEITEEYRLPFGEAIWSLNGAVLGPDGAIHIVLALNEHSVFHATNTSGEWEIHEVLRSTRFEEWTYPSMAVGPGGRLWIAHVDQRTDRLMLLSNARD